MSERRDRAIKFIDQWSGGIIDAMVAFAEAEMQHAEAPAPSQTEARVLTASDIERIGKGATKDVTCERCGTGGPIMRCGGSRNGCGCKCHHPPSQTEASTAPEPLIPVYAGDGNIEYVEASEYYGIKPQAAQTVASPTPELKHKALLHLKNWLRNDITPYHDRDTDCLNATFDQWIEQLSAFAADYAATLEARVAAQKNIIATLGEGKAVAGECAEALAVSLRDVGETLRANQYRRDRYSSKLEARTVTELICIGCSSLKGQTCPESCWLSSLLSRLSTDTKEVGK